VETFLRDSHEGQFDYMEKKFAVSLKVGLKSWSSFLEITERRNLFVHADGVVSKRYLEICRQNEIPTTDLIEGKTSLKVSHEYFLKSYNCLYEIGLKLGHVLLRKLFPEPEEVELADQFFNDVALNLIDLGEYDLACELLDSACDMWKNKFSNELFKMFMIVNSAQSHKWAGRNQKCQEIINKHDWSAKGDEFKLAKAVLTDDWNEGVKVMSRMGKTGPISDTAYRDWPIFKEFRQQEIFFRTYKDIFNQEFVIQTENN
jgi:hypothetical protein